MNDHPTWGHRRFAAWLFAATVAALYLAMTTGPVGAETVTVAAMNYEFKPAMRTVTVGDTVRWTFEGDPHSVTSRDGLFDSGVTDPGGSFSFKFATAGTYRYFCQVHPEQMFGTIVVEAASTPRPTASLTPRPTTRPTIRPAATPTPTPAPTPAPTPSASPPPSPSSTPPPSPLPTASETALASLGLVASALPTGSSASPDTTPTPASAPGGAPVVALALIAGAALAAGGLLVVRRRRMS